MASEYETRDEDESPRGLIAFITNLALKPFRIVLSRTALRAYLTTFLIIATGFVLLFFAITAYILFYWSYVPRIGFERTIHLQFDNVYNPSDSRYGFAHGASPYPYGTVTLQPDMVGLQEYDVAVELTLPRTPENTDAGNFMLEATMYAPHEKGSSSIMETVHAGIMPGSADLTVLATSRRSAILPYRSWLIEYIYKFTELHWYLLNFRQESDQLRTSMFEAVQFSKGWRNVPSTMKLEIQSTNRMQIYYARAIFRARFKGLRWLMYNYRVSSAVVFITGFWTTEMIFAGLAWAAITVFVLPRTQDVKAEEVHEVAERIKNEPQDDEMDRAPRLSDTERTFPTLSGQQPLRYQAEPKIKQEDDETTVVVPEHIIKTAEADIEDEDEDADFFLDSGLGTSMESSSVGRREIMRKRRGRTPIKEEGG